jgi:hypothetical protein
VIIEVLLRKAHSEEDGRGTIEAMMPGGMVGGACISCSFYGWLASTDDTPNMFPAEHSRRS